MGYSQRTHSSLSFVDARASVMYGWWWEEESDHCQSPNPSHSAPLSWLVTCICLDLILFLSKMFSECNIIKISSIARSLFTFNMKKHPTQNKLVKECEDSWVRESLTSPNVLQYSSTVERIITWREDQIHTGQSFLGSCHYCCEEKLCIGGIRIKGLAEN